MNMNENFKTTKNFAIDIVAEGNFVTVPNGLSSAIYQVESKTIRLNRVAMREWRESEFAKNVEDFENKLCHTMGYDGWDSFAVAQVLNNVFTVAAVRDITKSSDAE